MASKEKICVDSLAELSRFTFRLAQSLSGGETIGLTGSLGAGKTTLTRYLTKAFGSPDQVSSPTYVLEQEYRTEAGITLQHWDLYRLSRLPEDLDEDPGSRVVRIIEWIDKFPEYREKADILIEIENPFCTEYPERREITTEVKHTISL